MREHECLGDLPDTALDALSSVLGEVVAAGPNAAKVALRKLQEVNRERHSREGRAVRVWGSAGSENA